MANKKSVKRYVGVYYSESKSRKWRERPDRVYWINFKDVETGKLRWERCGWASEGWTPEAAQRRRYEFLEMDRTGAYKPKVDRVLESLTFGDLMEQNYLPWADENKRRSRDDRCMYRKWIEPSLGRMKLQEISPLDLERLKKEMRDAGKAEATVKHALCLVRQAFNKATAWGLWQGSNPCSAVSFPKPNNAAKRFLTRDEAELLLRRLWEISPQIARVATISLYGGLRVGEVFALKWSHLDWNHGVINVLDAKSGEGRPVFLTPPILQVLQDLPRGEPEDHIFKTKSGKPVVWLSKTFGRVVGELGFNKGIEDSRTRVTFHTLRHTYASWAVMAGVPLYVVGQALGHKTTAMTERYSHLAPDSYRKAFEEVANLRTPLASPKQ